MELLGKEKHAAVAHLVVFTTPADPSVVAPNRAKWYEADSDARMHRTRERPIPAGRIKRVHGLAFGVLVSITGFAEQWIEIHGPRITRIHLKDVLKHRGRSGDQSVYTNIFLGDNNWPAIRAAVDKVRYDGWMIAEMESRYRYAPDQQFWDTAVAIDRFIAARF